MPTIFTSTASQTSRNALLAKETTEEQKSLEKASPSLPPESVTPPAQEEPEEVSSEQEPVANVQQTNFAEDLILSQPSVASLLPPGDEVPKSPLKKYLPFVVLGVSLLVVLAVGVALQRNGTNPGGSIVLPTPTPEAPSELSVLQRELVLLEKDVEAADPLQAKLAFPPVNFELDLQDATILQQETAGRQRSSPVR